MNDNNPDADQWNARYAGGRPPWDLGSPPPALLNLIASLSPGERRVLVPCAGYGHDAIAWANAGHDAVAVDFAALAVERARDIARTRGANLQIEQADLFNLPSAYAGSFDLVWEQTCLAALDPERREAYFAAMAWALRPGGDFYGLLWNHGRGGGPPYDMNRQLVEGLAGPAFTLKSWQTLAPDIALRRGEFLVHLQKR